MPTYAAAAAYGRRRQTLINMADDFEKVMVQTDSCASDTQDARKPVIA
jgi:hypothetical protein